MSTGSRRDVGLRSRYLVSSLCLLALGFAMLAGCKRELAPPWNEPHFPLSQAVLLPGADEKGFEANYPADTPPADLFHEYQRALEEKGWMVQKQGASHDPSSNAYSVIVKRASERVLVTVTGGKPVHVKLNTFVD
jgi:hypothetical protein